MESSEGSQKEGNGGFNPYLVWGKCKVEGGYQPFCVWFESNGRYNYILILPKHPLSLKFDIITNNGSINKFLLITTH